MGYDLVAVTGGESWSPNLSLMDALRAYWRPVLLDYDAQHGDLPSLPDDLNERADMRTFDPVRDAAYKLITNDWWLLGPEECALLAAALPTEGDRLLVKGRYFFERMAKAGGCRVA